MSRILFYVPLYLLSFCCCNSNNKNLDEVNFSFDNAYAKWIFYSVNFSDTIGVLATKSGDLKTIENFNIINERIISIKYIKEDTLIYRFFIWNSKGLLQPKCIYMPWIIIQKNKRIVLGIMGELSTFSNYRECVQNFSELNNSIDSRYTPSGRYSQYPFPIENSEKEFISLLENQDNLKELNPWLYYYFNYVHKKQKLVWDTEILKDISGVIIEDKKRNPIMRVWLK